MKSTTVSKSSAPAGSRIRDCNCKHTHQDALHGVGKRVHNKCRGADPKRHADRCTVCGTKKES